MKTPWAFLLALPVLLTMWLISVGAVLTGSADLLNKVAWPAVSAGAVAYAAWAMMRSLRDRDAAPRKAEGFEAEGQQPGPPEEAASPK